MALCFPTAALCIVAATAAAAAHAASSDADRLAGLVALDRVALAEATGGFRIGDLEIGIGAVIRTTIADGAAPDAHGGFGVTDAIALEPGMPAAVFRLEAPGTAITGIGLATLIENAQSHRAISREVTLNVEIIGLAAAVRAATAARALGAAGPMPRLR